MIFLYILGALLLLVLALLLVAVVRTLLVKPSPAKTAVPPKSDPTRAKAYAEVLSEMIQVETISSRFEPEREKFDAFQARLVELFPVLYGACEA